VFAKCATTLRAQKARTFEKYKYKFQKYTKYTKYAEYAKKKNVILYSERTQ